MASNHRIELAAGEVLFREGDPPTSAYLVESGRLRITALHEGKPLSLADVEAGALVGEVAVLDDSPRTATVTALEPSVLTLIDRAQFAERLADADPIIRAVLLSQFARYRTALATFMGRTALPVAETLAVQQNAMHAQEKIRLESQLRDALESRSLETLLQPIREIAGSRTVGYEALTRWQHPERGAVSPTQFIALAEETSLIVPVGDYVLDAVCAALRRFIERWPRRTPYIGLNVSGRQIEDAHFIERVSARLAANGVPAPLLKIEITESLVLDYEQVARFLDRCRLAGIRVAIDDFGTGYSSLAHLHRLRFDTLKLDQAFVRQLDEPRCHAIVHAVVAMAEALDCDIVAEGVETTEQLEHLRALGCQAAQGYLIGRPAPLDAVLATAEA